MYLVVHGQHFVEYILRAVERKAQVAYAACFTFFHQEVYHAVFYVAGTESLDAAVANGVEQVVVNVVHLQLLKRTVVHGNGVFACIVGEVGQLGGYKKLLAWMAFERNAG